MTRVCRKTILFEAFANLQSTILGYAFGVAGWVAASDFVLHGVYAFQVLIL